MNLTTYLKNATLMLGAVSLLTLTACDVAKTSAPAKPSTPAKPGVAATVNGTPISDSRVNLMLQQSAAQGLPVTPEMRDKVIENLALQLIVSKEATKKGLDKPTEVADQLDLAKQSILARAFIQDYFKKNPVDEKTLTAEYDKVKASVSATEYKARHILVKQESEAKDIIAKLNKNPNAFEALAKEKSIDPGSKDNGGDLGWFDPQGMVPEFWRRGGQARKREILCRAGQDQFRLSRDLARGLAPKAVSAARRSQADARTAVAAAELEEAARRPQEQGQDCHHQAGCCGSRSAEERRETG